MTVLKSVHTLFRKETHRKYFEEWIRGDMTALLSAVARNWYLYSIA